MDPTALSIMLLFTAAISAVLFGGVGYWVSCQKGRNPIEGLVLGGAFGPLGVLIAAVLPTRSDR